MLIKAIILRPGHAPKITEIEDELRTYQKIVDGYIEPVTIGNELVALVNEEGKLLGMSPNFSIGYTTIVGPAVIVRDRGDVTYESLTDKQIDEALQIYEEGKHAL